MTFLPSELVIAGWTGRDEQALRRHIRELEEIGVKPPKSTPMFYRVAANLFCHADAIQVSGPDTSGEVEFVLMRTEDGLWVSVGSDHTDRKAETIGVTLSNRRWLSVVIEIDKPINRTPISQSDKDPRLDTYALLKVMWDQWNSVFGKVLGFIFLFMRAATPLRIKRLSDSGFDLRASANACSACSTSPVLISHCP